jgi:CBS domain-containing protein
MKVSECMTRQVYVIGPENSLREAAQRMAECDAGALPVGEDDRLVGVITDRDIAIRAVAHDLSPDTPVREVMSPEVLYCFEDDDIEKIAQNMGEQQIRRLPVVNADKRLVGIISLGDLAVSARATTTGRAVADISRPGGKHDQVVH